MSEQDLIKKQKNRIRGRVIFGLAAGIIGYYFSSWSYVIYVGLSYSIPEAIWMFRTTKSYHIAKNERNQPGEAIGYAISLTFLQFVFSSFLILSIGSIVKLIFNIF